MQSIDLNVTEGKLIPSQKNLVQEQSKKSELIFHLFEKKSFNCTEQWKELPRTLEQSKITHLEVHQRGPSGTEPWALFHHPMYGPVIDPMWNTCFDSIIEGIGYIPKLRIFKLSKTTLNEKTIDSICNLISSQRSLTAITITTKRLTLYPAIRILQSLKETNKKVSLTFICRLGKEKNPSIAQELTTLENQLAKIEFNENVSLSLATL